MSQIPHTDEKIHSLAYKSSTNQGQCILLQINPIKKSTIRFILYIILSVITVGLFALIVYWYPKFQRILLYSNSSIEQSTHFFVLNYDNQYSIVQRTNQIYRPTNKQQHPVIGFINRYMKYIYLNGTVKAVQFNYRKRITDIFSENTKGYNAQNAKQMRDCFSIGTIQIQQPNILILFGRQVFRPLYIFIVFSVILWYTQQYIYYASVIFFTSAVSIGINLYQVIQLNKKIFNMAYVNLPVNVLRDDKVINMSSVDVVPGDIVFLKDAIKLPFEGIIMEGSALINQCALTGQSVPIVKKADVFDNYKNQSVELDKSAYVFQGTTIIQVNMKKKMNKFQQFRQSFGIPVCVIRTNFSTLKGQLIRIISFPKQQQNQFQRQSTYFLIFLFILACASYSILIAKLHGIVQPIDLFKKFLDLITITVPPGLPVSMTFGIIFAIEKLKDKDIFCISQNKIISGGRVNYACFDKTGTLTEDFMDFYGLVPCSQKKFYPFIQNQQQNQGVSQKKIQQNLKKSPYIAHALCNMASNHSIIKIQNTNELVGDPMQIKLFQFGQYDLDFSNHNPDVVFSFNSTRNHKGTVYRRFQFDSDVQRMSVITSNSQFNNQNYVYCKGSPQIMLQIFESSSVPQNYKNILKQYASKGFRVLAIGSRLIKDDLKTVQRIDVQKNLQFDGFQIFENKLKKQTYNAIQQLKQAQIPCAMITGDNPLTGSNIAFKCEIANLQKKMLICDFKNNVFQTQEFFYYEQAINHEKRKKYLQKNPSQKKNSKVVDNYLESQQNLQNNQPAFIQLKTQDASPKFNYTKGQSADCQSADQFLKSLIDFAKNQNYQFCLTGSAFNTLYSQNLQKLTDIQKQFVKHVSVYSRTKPNDKVRVVSLYQSLGNTVLMCGDGANDCGALKQADVGLSLSQAEASISAPFTSKVINISAVVQLIKQCRAGLATNFSLFNIMALYSLIQYTSTIIAQLYFAYPSDFHYLYWDLAGNFFFFLTFGYTGTVRKLSRDRPSSSLFSITNIFQVIFMFVIQLIGQIIMIIAISGPFAQDSNYATSGGIDNNRLRYQQELDFILDTPQTNVLFLFTNFMYIFSLLAFSISKPWRKEFYTNIAFMIVLLLVGVYSILLIIVPGSRLDLFEISHMNSQKLNGFILGLSFAFGIFMYACQKFIFEPVSYKLKQKYPTISYL